MACLVDCDICNGSVQRTGVDMVYQCWQDDSNLLSALRKL